MRVDTNDINPEKELNDSQQLVESAIRFAVQTEENRDRNLEESSTRSAIEHNMQYSKIIACYTEHAQKSLELNCRWKSYILEHSNCFLRIIGITFLVLTICAVILAFLGKDYGAVGVCITAISTFVSAYIVLPVTITKYLFNPDESKDLNGIVKSMQDHDYRMTHEDSADKLRLKDNALPGGEKRSRTSRIDKSCGD